MIKTPRPRTDRTATSVQGRDEDAGHGLDGRSGDPVAPRSNGGVGAGEGHVGVVLDDEFSGGGPDGAVAEARIKGDGTVADAEGAGSGAGVEDALHNRKAAGEM